ncbi:hypothetical protein Q0M94_20865 (plasmid) [Deinococcus radiomollis]|uniref:hypothetical protein n=1 Tax=Deinococcus radiomollis TaxID=468916 RepID=UPI00389239F4
MADDLHDNTRADGTDERGERHMADSARQHVGAAGFAQRNVLEQIITAGREQIVYTRALRKVVASTLRQLEAQEDRVERVPSRTLQQIVSSGQRQIETAQQLKDTIQQTLSNVLDTPLDLVSAQVLAVLSESVRRQARHLELLIQVALNEAASDGQVSGSSTWKRRLKSASVMLCHARPHMPKA